MYCRCTLIVRTTTGRVKWDGNQFHLPNDLSKEIRDKVFRSFNPGNQSQIKKKNKNNREPAQMSLFAFQVIICQWYSLAIITFERESNRPRD